MPASVVVSKLGIEASASGDAVTGLLCLKVATTNAGRARHVLFSNPSLSFSQPEIRALPLGQPSQTSRLPSAITKAARLLNLGVGQTLTLESRSHLPVIDVSPSGQVSLINSGRVSGDWLITLAFTAPIHWGTSGTRQVSIGLPKCLDNVIRFQIVSSSSSPGEVSILTEPRMLPLPPFSDTDEDNLEEGSWLEGRFQSTDNLFLEWSFGSPSANTLQITPHWHPSRPSIGVRFETTHVGNSTVFLEAVIPEGWGWDSLAITGKGLAQWRSVDGDWWEEVSADILDTSDDDDESFSTVRQTPSKRTRTSLSKLTSPTYSSVSLLRQTMPSQLNDVGDFSFEQSSSASQSPVRQPLTPVATPKPHSAQHSHSRRAIGGPAPAKLFELCFSGPSLGFVMQGSLVPISHLTLVGRHILPPLPFVKIDDSTCEVSGDVLLHSSSTLEPNQIDTSKSYVGTLVWPGGPCQAPTSAVYGDVYVGLNKNAWGVVTAHVSLTSAKGQVLVHLADSGVRVVSASVDGVPVPRAAIKTEDAFSITLAPQESPSPISLVLELEANSKIALPRFSGRGKMVVKLEKGWDATQLSTNMKRVSSTVYTIDHSSSSPYLEACPVVSGWQMPAVFSRANLFSLFMLWLLISMAQQVQRLRSEVALIKEEAKDWRLYALAPPVADPVAIPHDGWSDTTAQMDSVNTVAGSHDIGTSVGRVMFGGSVWDTLAVHPTVKSFRQGLGWVWQALVWLVGPTTPWM